MTGPEDPLAALRDIHLPAEPGWWPPAPGWWLLSLLVLAVLTVATLYLKKRHARSLPWRWIKRRLVLLKARHAETADPVGVAGELSTLLRHAALARYPREQVAGLTGERWLQFLDQSGGTDQFTHGAGRCLTTTPYRRYDSFDMKALFGVVDDWIDRNT